MIDNAEIQDEELDDFESSDLEDVADSDHSYLRDMWRNYGFRRTDQGSYGFRRTDQSVLSEAHQMACDTVTAHGMVQTFVNAFARDGRYVVTFDASVSTAGTDMTEKRVVITPAPIADPHLDAQQAGLILTGLAVHEICHPRYGRGTAWAVQKTFPVNRVADRLSNLLDDVRIERRFVADYPGYAGVFEPTLSYVGASTIIKGKKIAPTLRTPVNLAIAAVRYPTFSEWTAETEVEASWWRAWADRWSKEDAPRRHVAAIREALQHIVETKPALEPKVDDREDQYDQDFYKPDQPGSSDVPNDVDESDDDAQATPANSPAEGDASHDEKTPTSDKELNDQTMDADDEETEHSPSCSGSDAIDRAARDSGASRDAVWDLKKEAQQTVENAHNVEGDGHGHTIDVAQSLKGLTRGGERLGGSSLAQRYVRNAILRSRTGHQAVSSFKRHGRLDQKGLQRLAGGDFRVFERRTAPSPGKYLVWVMVDCSGSMTGEIKYAAQVAHAMAAATGGIPSVRMAIWAWSDPFRPAPATAGVAKVWETGQSVLDIFKMSGLQKNGTPDSRIMSWSARAIKHAARGDETPVVIFISDGSGHHDMNEMIAEARSMGVVVKGVSFGYSMRDSMQEERYGRGNYVPWAGSIIATARPLADLFAKITSGR